MEKVYKHLPPVLRTTAGLREALFDHVNGLRDGTVTLAEAKAMATLAGRIIDSIRVQVQAQKLVSKDGGAPLPDLSKN